MGLLEKLKSALGLDGAESTSDTGPTGDVDVTVEREPSTEDEDAVKGTDTATTESGSADETAAEGVPDEESGSGVGTDPPSAAEQVPEADTDADADVAPGADIPEAEPASGSDDPVTEIKGIGPAYAKRLAGIGIETVGDLANAEAAEIASETDLSETRVVGWIEQAEEY